jgi:hypothetical protein
VLQEINSTIPLTPTHRSKSTARQQRISLQQHPLAELQYPKAFQLFHESSPHLLFRLLRNIVAKIQLDSFQSQQLLLFRSGFLVKDLRLLRRPLDRVGLVDDLAGTALGMESAWTICFFFAS